MMELGDLAELLIAKCAQKKYYMQWHQWAWLLGGGGGSDGARTVDLKAAWRGNIFLENSRHRIKYKNTPLEF
jgi:hypothetical protein